MKVISVGKPLSIREFNAEIDAIQSYNNKIRNREVPMLPLVAAGATATVVTEAAPTAVADAATPVIDITENEFEYDDVD